MTDIKAAAFILACLVTFWYATDKDHLDTIGGCLAFLSACTAIVFGCVVHGVIAHVVDEGAKEIPMFQSAYVCSLGAYLIIRGEK